MATKTFYTDNYGEVTIKDVMIDTDGTNIVSGIDIFDENNDLIVEVAHIETDMIDEPFQVENLINFHQ